MPIPTIYIDSTGIHAPDYPQILEFLHAHYRSIFGQDVYLEADSQDGQMLAVIAMALADTNAACVAVYNSFSPATAQGTGLSQQVKINGIRRHGNSFSTVELRLVGQPGTIITHGQVQDVLEQQWILPLTVTIPVGGEIMVTATAELAGDVRAAAGTVTRMYTPTRGWQSVSNPLAATVGRKVEQDAELRRRQATSTALPSRTVLEGTVGAVAALPGVTRWRAYENDQNETDANGLPGHSIALVVEGGDTRAIAEAIAAKKTPGTYTYGDTEVFTTDKFGVPNTMRFFRPRIVDIHMAIIIRPLPGYLSTTGDAVKAALAAYVNALPIGEDVLLAKLFVPGNLGNIPASAATFDIESLTLGRMGQALTAANIDVLFNEAATLHVDNITLREIGA